MTTPLLRPTIRVRFTLLYGGVFLLTGALLIVVLYYLFQENMPAYRIASHFPRVLENVQGISQQDIERLLDAQRAQASETLLQQSLVALGLVAALAVLLGWLMAGRVLRPVQQITATTRRVADRNLHERIGLEGPQDELKELADTIDAMLERLDRSFDSQRRFVANASHELRTPLAINRTLLEVAVAHSEVTPDLRTVVNTLLTTNERSERLLDGLLALMRSENEPAQRHEVDLSDVAAESLELTAAEASARGISVEATPEPATTKGDPALLERLALNLVQNGVRHNHRGGWVRVQTGSASPEWAELIVTNTGPEVPTYEANQIFEPFRRLANSSRAEGDQGVGLGLSIVRSVARTHGGDVTATPREGGGLIVRVRLPHASITAVE